MKYKRFTRSQSLAHSAVKRGGLWHFDSSDHLCQQVRQSQDSVLLSFSRGKDSIATYLHLLEYFAPENIHLYFYYLAPDIPFVEDSLQYYEDRFNTKILRLPSPAFLNNINSFYLQTPNEMEYIRGDFGADGLDLWYDGDLQKCNIILADLAREHFDLPHDRLVAVGNRADDNLQRGGVIRKYGPIISKQRKFYPIYDFSIRDTMTIIRRHGVKLPIDYKIWGRSFDGLDYRFTNHLMGLIIDSPS
jgi:predicted phosphoadenosine phosphosulfate sulfurtransferase